MSNKSKTIILAGFLGFIILAMPHVSHGATEVYFQKSTNTIQSGDIFTADLKISTDKNINAIDGTLIYDPKMLEATQVNIDQSFLSLWAKEPSINNQTGELEFAGGTPDGFSGKNGLILQVSLKAKRPGTALVSFKDTFSAYANDGKGTQINPWLRPMQISILSGRLNYQYIWWGLLSVALLLLFKLFLYKKNGK